MAAASASAVTMTPRTAAPFVSTSSVGFNLGILFSHAEALLRGAAGREVIQEVQKRRPVEGVKVLTGRRRPSAKFQYFSGKSLCHNSPKRKSYLPILTPVLAYRSGDHSPGLGSLSLFSPRQEPRLAENG